MIRARAAVKLSGCSSLGLWADRSNQMISLYGVSSAAWQFFTFSQQSGQLQGVREDLFHGERIRIRSRRVGFARTTLIPVDHLGRR